MLPLGLLSPGENGEIIEVRTRHCHADGQCQCGESRKSDFRIEDMGLRIGRTVEMLNNGSPILLRVGESRIAVDRGLAMKIMVRQWDVMKAHARGDARDQHFSDDVMTH